MGLVQRDGIERLRHAKKYSGFFGSICTNLAWTGWMMGAGALAGPDPREMAKSDCVVIWGTNAVVTQVNVMTHAVRARKERGAKIVVIDIYDNATMKQADMGSDPEARHRRRRWPARSCMCCSATAWPTGPISRNTPTIRRGSRRIWRTRTPEWAAAITGLVG